MRTAREREGGKEWSKIASEVLSWPEPGEGIIYKYAMRVDGNKGGRGDPKSANYESGDMWSRAGARLARRHARCCSAVVLTARDGKRGRSGYCR